MLKLLTKSLFINTLRIILLIIIICMVSERAIRGHCIAFIKTLVVWNMNMYHTEVMLLLSKQISAN